MQTTPKLLLAALLLNTSPSWALKTDADQPIHIQADRMELDDPAGTNLYIGHVHISQGSLQINAERLEIHADNNQIQKMTASGSNTQQTRFSQRTDDGQEITATADQIQYDEQHSTLILQGRAEFKNPQNLIRGKRIEYNTRTHKLIAGQNTTPETNAEKERVHVTIQPAKKKTQESQ